MPTLLEQAFDAHRATADALDLRDMLDAAAQLALDGGRVRVATALRSLADEWDERAQLNLSLARVLSAAVCDSFDPQ